MLDRLEASFRRERLFLRQTSHELRTPITVDRLVADVTSRAAALLNGRLHVAPPQAGVTRADAHRLTQALINLLQNAAEHTPPDTAIRFRTAATASGWRFEVADQGGGLPPGTEDERCQPFFTANASPGSGLRLCVVAGIARAHGGVAGVDNEPGYGATFWVEIPR
jgi:two-component system OmpR family sensor kinase